MERLTKKQKEILIRASKAFPNGIYNTSFPQKPGEDILPDLKILEAKGLVTLSYPVGAFFPTFLTITPRGIEKLQENFITQLKDTAYNNPLALIAIIISLLSLFANYFYINNTTQKIQVDLDEVKGKIAEYDTLIVKKYNIYK